MLCTFDVDDLKIGHVATSAASYIAMAIKWMMAFELVHVVRLIRKNLMQME